MADSPNTVYETKTGELKSLPTSITKEADYGIHEASEGTIERHVAEARAQAEQDAFDKQYSATEHPLDAGLALYGGAYAGWLRGVTQGLSDVAISKIGDALGVDARGQLNDWKRVHPWISKSEQLTGAAGGLAASGAGLGAVGRGAIGAAGIAEGGGIAASIGIGEGTVARTIAGTLARGAVEGGVISGGEELSRQALSRDPDIHAERILSEMGHGAIFGGPAALGLHGLSSVASSGLTALESSLARRAAVDTGEEGIAGLQSLAKRGASKGELLEHATKLDSELGSKFVEKLKAIDEAGNSGPSMKEFLAKADEQVFKGLARETENGFVPIPGKEAEFATAAKWADALHSRFAEPLEKTGDDIGALRHEVWKAETKLKSLDGDAYGQGIDDWQAARGKLADAEDAAEAARVVRYKDVGFKEWEEAGRELSTSIKDKGGVATKMRNLMSEVSDSALDASPSEAVNEAKTVRDLYKAIRDTKQVLSHGSAEEVAAAVGEKSLVDKGVSLAGKKIGDYVTDVAVHTALSPLGPVGSLIAPMAKRLIRQVAEGASLEGVSSAVREHIQSATRALASGGRVATEKGIEPLGVALGSDVRASAERIRSRATELASSPDRQLHYATETAASLRVPAPMAASISGSIARQVSVLAARAPKEKSSAGLFKAAKVTMSDSEAHEYVSIAKAVAAPRSIIADAKSGTITKSQVDAVREAWPNLYPEIATDLTKAITGGKKEPTYQSKIAISVLLGIDADPTMDPSFVAATQPDPYKKQDQGDGEKPRSGKPIKLPSLALSASGADSAIARAQSGGKSK